MSLLIKALERAARNRNKSDTHEDTSASFTSSATRAIEAAPSHYTSDARVLPTLEPLSSRTATDDATPLPDDSAAAPRATRSAASMPNIDAGHQYTHAADTAPASRATLTTVGWFLQTYPLASVGGLAASLGVAFGAYVYFQIAEPVRVVATKPPLHTPAPPATNVTPDAVSPGMSPSTIIGASNTPQTISAAAILPTHGKAEPQREANAIRNLPSVGADEKSRDLKLPPQASAPVTHSESAVSIEPLRPRVAITVVSTTRQGRLNSELTGAYSALHAGDSEASHTLYRRVLQSDPLNIDALLGMAYLAAHSNRTEEEIKLYLRILELNPRHGAAQAALIGIMSKADPVLAETRMKQLIAKEPTAFLHFVLGNVYADQSLWSQAQSSYFQAHHLEPENPDYAYNLAIGLDHLRQSKVALNFYRRAERLAATHGRSHFNPARLRERITALAAQLE